jgi:hypothetical protein
MLDHYFDFALDLMQIASPEQQPEKSLLSPYYQEPSRLVYGRDYEQAFNQPVDK